MCDTCNPWCDYSCVRINPQGMARVNGYDDFVPTLPVKHNRSASEIMWEVKFKNGTIKRIKIPVKDKL